MSDISTASACCIADYFGFQDEVECPRDLRFMSVLRESTPAFLSSAAVRRGSLTALSVRFTDMSAEQMTTIMRCNPGLRHVSIGFLRESESASIDFGFLADGDPIAPSLESLHIRFASPINLQRLLSHAPRLQRLSILAITAPFEIDHLPASIEEVRFSFTCPPSPDPHTFRKLASRVLSPLKRVGLSGSFSIDDECIRSLHPDTESLHVMRTNASLIHVLHHMPRLQQLHMDLCAVRLEFTPPLRPHMRDLSLVKCGLRNSDLIRILQSMPNLHSLDISFNLLLTHDSLSSIPSLRELRTLSVFGIDDDHDHDLLHIVRSCPSLSHLRCSSTRESLYSLLRSSRHDIVVSKCDTLLQK